MTPLLTSRRRTDQTAAWQREADAVTLPRLDNAAACPRPGHVGTTYTQHQYQALADEQDALWAAEGERNARPHQAQAAAHTPAAAATEFLLQESENQVRQAHADHQHAVRTLLQHVKRSSGAKLRYWVGLPVLWLGDTGGVWSAAVINGDIVYIALLLALASGVAGICSGLVGAELRSIRLARARQREPEHLTDDERRYQQLFAGPGGGMGIVALTGLVSIAVVGFIAIGVGTLRASTDGSAAGTTFGLLAAATALASGLLGYSATDDVADLLDTLAKRVRYAEARHLELASSEAMQQRARALVTANSLSDEHALRGQAAAHHMDSLSWRIQVRNPAVLGHGFPAGEQGGVIGRRPRRGGAA
ncbi:hypothetical protein [Amycolatopsis samaneae]|uniref:SMODS and SLOG-associating 2TM effector domain-containing protein n=1 Tax=Amycolatopsis samaneae TaxID=664691 RepID=A0ABW5GIA4_9PSEU